MDLIWVPKREQNMTTGLACKISKQSSENQLEIKHRVDASKLKF